MSRWLICWNWKITSSSGVCRQGRPCNPRQWKQRLSHTVWFRDSGLQMMSPSLAWTELEETMESLHWNELHIHVCLHIATRMLWLKHSPNWGHSRPCPVGAALTGTITLPRNELISSASRILSHAVNSKHFGKEMRNGRWVRRVLLIRFFFFCHDYESRRKAEFAYSAPGKEISKIQEWDILVGMMRRLSHLVAGSSRMPMNRSISGPSFSTNSSVPSVVPEEQWKVHRPFWFWTL